MDLYPLAEQGANDRDQYHHDCWMADWRARERTRKRMTIEKLQAELDRSNARLSLMISIKSAIETMLEDERKFIAVLEAELKSYADETD